MSLRSPLGLGPNINKKESNLVILRYQMKRNAFAFVTVAAASLLLAGSVPAQSQVGRAANPEYKDVPAVAERPAPAPKKVTLSGRVISTFGVGLHGVWVTLDGGEEPMKVLTDSFGNFSFDDVVAGEGYLLTVQTDRYRFDGQNKFVVANRNAKGIEFVTEL
jgi:hypothetical protein